MHWDLMTVNSVCGYEISYSTGGLACGAMLYTCVSITQLATVTLMPAAGYDCQHRTDDI